MDAIECLKTRRSMRVYHDRTVSREVLQELLDCARLAPTGGNAQPWEFVVVTAAEQRADIADLCEYGSFIADAPVCVLLFCRPSGHYLEDASCAATCLMLAAHAHGLGACWVHVHGKACEAELAAMVDAPAELRLICCLAVGYGESASAPPKRELADVVHQGRFT
jgi:nitroreductase